MSTRLFGSRELLLALVAAASCAIVFAFDPSVTPFYPRCVFHSLTGLQCPGCGGTRALHLLLHGNVIAAMRLNAMMFVFLPFIATAVARPKWAQRPWVGWTAVWLLIAWGVARNLLHL